MKRLNSSTYSSAQTVALNPKLVKAEKRRPAMKEFVMHNITQVPLSLFNPNFFIYINIKYVRHMFPNPTIFEFSNTDFLTICQDQIKCLSFFQRLKSLCGPD